ncbi:hypothetical protein [Streptomyces sp. NPDC001422]|uniref:hypothetical protein n=1 Tax=Streptomyces sp. NPDC001422 TaxID=3364575 RepID=UPI0036B9AA6B
MRFYSELNALPPDAFLNPENFVTEYDGRVPERAEEQYREGLRLSAEYDRIVIRAGGTWAAESGLHPRLTNVYMGKCAYSYEGIGYHGNTADLLRGFLDGPAPVDVERRQEDYSVITTRIKEGTK